MPTASHTLVTDDLLRELTQLRADVSTISDRENVRASHDKLNTLQRELDALEAKRDLGSADEIANDLARAEWRASQQRRDLLRMSIREAVRAESDVVSAEGQSTRDEMFARYRKVIPPFVRALKIACEKAAPVQALDIRCNELFAGSIVGMDRIVPPMLGRNLEMGRSWFDEWVESLKLAGLLDAE